MDFDAHFFVAKPNALPKRRNRIPKAEIIFCRRHFGNAMLVQLFSSILYYVWQRLRVMI